MILSIVEMDEVVLRQETYEVDDHLTVQSLIRDMFDTLDSACGYGLSAIQVNRSERVFVFQDKGRSLVFINPVITRQWGKIVTAEEGCLSLPPVLVKVPRHKFIKIDYMDEHGTWNTNRKFRGHDARVIQHECDHLAGKLIVDYARGK